MQESEDALALLKDHWCIYISLVYLFTQCIDIRHQIHHLRQCQRRFLLHCIILLRHIFTGSLLTCISPANAIFQIAETAVSLVRAQASIGTSATVRLRVGTSVIGAIRNA